MVERVGDIRNVNLKENSKSFGLFFNYFILLFRYFVHIGKSTDSLRFRSEQVSINFFFLNLRQLRVK